MKKLTGSISTTGSLGGKLSCPVVESGEYDIYAGATSIVPKPYSQTLDTANTIMKKDIEIAEIPYSETSNQSKGKTVYIG